MAGELWGFWLRCCVRDGDLGVPRGDLGGLMAIRFAGLGTLILAGSGWLGAVVAVLAS
jgi:hypothetical protein